MLSLHNEISIYSWKQPYLFEEVQGIFSVFSLNLTYMSHVQVLFKIYRNHIIIDNGILAPSSTILCGAKWTIVGVKLKILH